MATATKCLAPWTGSSSLSQGRWLRGEAVVDGGAVIDRLLGPAGADRREAVAQRLDQIRITLRRTNCDLGAGDHVERTLDRGGVGRDHAVADELVDRGQIRARVL